MERLIQLGGVKVDEEKVDTQEIDAPFDLPAQIQIGKRPFAESV